MPRTRMTCRDATASDAPLLARANQELIREEWRGEGMSLPRLEERMRRWITEEDYRAVVFEEGEAAVAYCLFSVDEESAYIRHFFVFPEHRGRGVGSGAMRRLLDDLIPRTARVTLDVLAANRAGHAFWRSAGFTDYSVRMERLPAEETPSAG